MSIRCSRSDPAEPGALVRIRSASDPDSIRLVQSHWLRLQVSRLIGRSSPSVHCICIYLFRLPPLVILLGPPFPVLILAIRLLIFPLSNAASPSCFCGRPSSLFFRQPSPLVIASQPMLSRVPQHGHCRSTGKEDRPNGSGGS